MRTEWCIAGKHTHFNWLIGVCRACSACGMRRARGAGKEARCVEPFVAGRPGRKPALNAEHTPVLREAMQRQPRSARNEVARATQRPAKSWSARSPWARRCVRRCTRRCIRRGIGRGIRHGASGQPAAPTAVSWSMSSMPAQKHTFLPLGILCCPCPAPKRQNPPKRVCA